MWIKWHFIKSSTEASLSLSLFPIYFGRYHLIHGILKLKLVQYAWLHLDIYIKRFHSPDPSFSLLSSSCFQLSSWHNFKFLYHLQSNTVWWVINEYCKKDEPKDAFLWVNTQDSFWLIRFIANSHSLLCSWEKIVYPPTDFVTNESNLVNNLPWGTKSQTLPKKQKQKSMGLPSSSHSCKNVLFSSGSWDICMNALLKTILTLSI